MTRERKKAPAPTRGVRALNRRAKMERAQQQHPDDGWRTLNALKDPPKMKHKTTFELVENVDKKKKLEFKITTDRHPPPGFEFVPVGHPDLSHACKELSREQDAMIFIVSDSKDPGNLDHHVNRVGYHFRQMIVDQARSKLAAAGQVVNIPRAHRHGEPEPIPQSQWEIDAQADAVLRDLFPRIPHTDRREIIQHAFQKDGKFHGEYKVGMVKELTLARRVQLAAIAHIRHRHTRYDELLREANWVTARKAVEKPCLDIIVKWRGDEETGRDQLDEILREVIEISDTEEESDDETLYAEATPARRVTAIPAETLSRPTAEPQGIRLVDHQPLPQTQSRDLSNPDVLGPSRQKAIAKAEKKSARKTQRFRRYAAAAEALAGSSANNVYANDSNVAPFRPGPIDLTRSPGSVHPIGSSSREPTVAARGTPNVEQMSRLELRSDSQRFSRGPPRETYLVPRGLPEANMYASPRPLHGQESYVPKVGHAAARYDNPSAPLSPVRHGLQDMLLQSIEPASPIAPREAPGASRPLYREPQRFAEGPRVIPRSPYNPVGSASRPGSPRMMSNGNVLVTRRHHDSEYISENFDTYPGSFVQANQQVRGEDLQRAPPEYLPERPLPSFRVRDEAFAQTHSRPIPNEGVTQYNGNVPPRNRAHPIIIDDDDAIRRPRQVVEVQRLPDGDYPDISSRTGAISRDVPVRRETRIRDDARVVLNTPPSRPRSAFDYQDLANHTSLGSTYYQEPGVYRTPAHTLHHRVAVPPPHPESNYYREPVQHLAHEPREWSNDVFGGVRADPLGPARPEIHYVDVGHHPQERLNFAPISHPHQDQQESRFYRLYEAVQPAPQQVEYQHNYPPQLIGHPIHGHHIEHHGPPLRHYVPEQRVVWVDR